MHFLDALSVDTVTWSPACMLLLLLLLLLLPQRAIERFALNPVVGSFGRSQIDKRCRVQHWTICFRALQVGGDFSIENGPVSSPFGYRTLSAHRSLCGTTSASERRSY
jgi:hypothetical protein